MRTSARLVDPIPMSKRGMTSVGGWEARSPVRGPEPAARDQVRRNVTTSTSRKASAPASMGTTGVTPW